VTTAADGDRARARRRVLGRSVLRVSGRAVAVLVLGAAVALLVGLPLILLAVPQPRPVVADLDDEHSGGFVTAGGVLYKVFLFTAAPLEFPVAQAARADPGAQVVVKARRLDGLSRYGLHSYDDGLLVPVVKSVPEPGVLRMTPEEPLAPGRYYVEAARDGAFGGRDYFYFSVSD